MTDKVYLNSQMFKLLGILELDCNHSTYVLFTNIDGEFDSFTIRTFAGPEFLPCGGIEDDVNVDSAAESK